ncbi:MAG: methyltransferase domain-containing protein [Opitutaceae bacterium]|nr:methyltransferase domain-containing protein [Opitutaceae bacterium]
MCTLCKTLDPSKVDAFGGRLLGILNSAGLALMISVGHRTGLFDTLATLPPCDAPTLAGVAGLNERYVREWLGAMTTGRIVELDAVAGTYRLPAEHAALLTRAASPNNMAAFMQYPAILGQVEDRIVECFKHGGGVPYSAFGRFHAVMAEDSGQTVVSALFDHILPIIPGLAEKLERGIDVMDVGCGRGVALAALARRFPRSRFTGIDFSPEAIAWANENIRADGLANIRYFERDAAKLDYTEGFDFITTFDAVHDQARPDLVLAGIRRALRPGGIYLMQDIHSSSSHAGDMEHPAAPFLYTISTFHCMTVSLAHNGLGLGTMWGRETAKRMLAEAGFTRVEIQRLAHDFQNDYYLVQP